MGRLTVSVFIVILAGLAYLFYPPKAFPDRLAAIPENETTIDNVFYNKPEIASTWWDRSGKLGGLFKLNPARVAYFERLWKEKLSAQQVSSGKFLDVGCGGGLATEELAKAGFDMTGMDMSPRSLETARKHAEENGVKNVKYVEGSAYKIPFADASFDGVVMSDVLEHIHDLHQVISEISRVLKPNGVFVFDTVTRTFVSNVLHVIMQDLAGACPGHTHDWRLFVTPEEMQTVLTAHGFEVRAFWHSFLVCTATCLSVCACVCAANELCVLQFDAKSTSAMSLQPELTLAALKSVPTHGLFSLTKDMVEAPHDKIMFTYLGWAKKL